MKICQSHWDKLKAKVREAGMWHLVSADAQSAIERLKKELREEETVFDPLMACNNLISGHAIQAGGLYIMGRNEDGSEYCPLCEVDKNKTLLGEDSDAWIDHATEACLRYCDENNLLNQQ